MENVLQNFSHTGSSQWAHGDSEKENGSDNEQHFSIRKHMKRLYQIEVSILEKKAPSAVHRTIFPTPRYIGPPRLGHSHDRNRGAFTVIRDIFSGRVCTLAPHTGRSTHSTIFAANARARDTCTEKS